MRILVKRLCMAACVLGIGLLTVGCGTDYAPTSPSESEVAGPEQGSLVLAASPEAALRAAKTPAKARAICQTQPTYEYYGTNTSRTVEGWVGSAGGWLRVAVGNDTPQNSLVADFVVPAGALDQPRLLNMTIRGDLLSEMVAEFQPGGLQFLKGATLTLWVGFNRVDVGDRPVRIWHVYSDGTVEEVLEYGLRQQGTSTLTIAIPVQGFSRYGLRSS